MPRGKGGSGGSYEEFSQRGYMEWEWLPSFSSATCSELQEELLGEGQEKKMNMFCFFFVFLDFLYPLLPMLTCPVSPALLASRRAPASTFFFFCSFSLSPFSTRQTIKKRILISVPFRLLD